MDVKKTLFGERRRGRKPNLSNMALREKAWYVLKEKVVYGR